MTNAMQKKTTQPPIIQYLQRPDVMDRFSNFLPATLTAPRVLGIMESIVNGNRKLGECSVGSVLNAFAGMAQIGIDPTPALGLGYVIPYGKQATFVLGYKGMIELAYRSGRVSRIVSRIVYEGDEFRYSLGLNEDLVHVPKHQSETITHVYCIIHLKGGEIPLFEVMTAGDCRAIKKRSRAGTDGPWVTDFGPMCQKTVFRRAWKYAPKTASPEVAQAIAAEDAFAQAAEKRSHGQHATIDGEYLQMGDLPGLEELEHQEEEPKPRKKKAAKKLADKLKEKPAEKPEPEPEAQVEPSQPADDAPPLEMTGGPTHDECMAMLGEAQTLDDAYACLAVANCVNEENREDYLKACKKLHEQIKNRSEA